ncbi:hypothetical protein MTBBW1_2470006 [Desulfamplus magnetovallimortis]|uniref:Ribonuclease H n=1 Tax=Desulfamplus magnetovallimortis TaxID=1246637 RepID=A0A1W1HEA9_9BACT|nr:RNase H1/viroplasmin domain-containing protein [Desulfamplus magnetovallimortis]SLM30819.1 hypothetical protein MTBBW1_2470006 [Desulfamplus magnetovallimortis]
MQEKTKTKTKTKKFSMILEELQELKEMVMRIERAINSSHENRTPKPKSLVKLKSKKRGCYYAVVIGFTPGIYTDWKGPNGAERQVKGYSNSLYKKFKTEEEAARFMDHHSDY